MQKNRIGFLFVEMIVWVGFLFVQHQTQFIPETVERIEAGSNLQEQIQQRKLARKLPFDATIQNALMSPPNVVTDSSIEVGITPETTLMSSISITNTGGGVLTWTVQEDDGGIPVAVQMAESATAGLQNDLVNTFETTQPLEEVTPMSPEAPINLTLDDGSFENAIGFGTSILFSNRFTLSATDFPFELQTVTIGFPSSALGVNAGEALTIYVFEDIDNEPNNGGINLVTSFATTVQTPGALNTYTLSPPVQLEGPGDIWIGYYNSEVANQSGEGPLLFDSTTTQQRSWISSNPAIPNQSLIDFFGPGNHVIRGTGETITSTPATCEAPDNISWLTVSPTSGNVVSNTTNIIDLIFDSSGLSTGVYTGTLCMETNDPANLNLQIPVTMTVCNAPIGTLDVTTSHSSMNTTLSWSTVGADFYEIHWSADPYFIPSSSTLQATSGTGSYTHMGSHGNSYYYLVIPADNCGNRSVTGNSSNEIGSFEFAIVPGT